MDLSVGMYKIVKILMIKTAGVDSGLVEAYKNDSLGYTQN